MNREQLKEGFAQHIYYQKYPISWKSLTDEAREKWRKQADSILDYLGEQGVGVIEKCPIWDWEDYKGNPKKECQACTKDCYKFQPLKGGQ